MSKQPAHGAADPDPHGWQDGIMRVLANALLALLALEVVAVVGLAVGAVAGWPGPPGTPLEWGPFAAAFYLVRWVYVLPALLLVLVGLEYVARRVPHARVLTAIVAFGPMALWELTQTAGDLPSPQGAFLGVTALLFAVLARLPARRFQGPASEHRGARARI